MAKKKDWPPEKFVRQARTMAALDGWPRDKKEVEKEIYKEAWDLYLNSGNDIDDIMKTRQEKPTNPRMPSAYQPKEQGKEPIQGSYIDSEVDIETIAKEQGFNFKKLKNRVKKNYLEEVLNDYNSFFLSEYKKIHSEEKKYHNELLVQAKHGLLNLNNNLPEKLGDILNLDEICLFTAGVYKAKEQSLENKTRNIEELGLKKPDFKAYVKSLKEKVERGEYPEDYVLNCEQSRLAYGGQLEKGLYEILSELIDNDAFNYFNEKWHNKNKISEEKKKKSFEKANPYDPETLKHRCNMIEEKYPATIQELKEELARPFVPIEYAENKRYGQRSVEEVVHNKGGFKAPGKKTPRSQIYWGDKQNEPKTFWRIDEYAKKFAEALK